MKLLHTQATRRALLRAIGVLAALGAGARAAAQDKVVRIILPNATGSGVDAITRGAQNALARALSASVIVDNQPGAGGIVGLSALARSAPDGNTISVVSNNVVIFPSVYKSLPFAMPGDFTPIAVCGYTPMILVVNPKVPARPASRRPTFRTRASARCSPTSSAARCSSPPPRCRACRAT